jgi:chromosome segregation ATPase
MDKSEDGSMAQLLAHRAQVEQEMLQAQKAASSAALELSNVKELMRPAEKRLQMLQEALKNLRGPAEIVLLKEFAQIRDLAIENDGIVRLYKSQIEAVKTKGLAAAEKAKHFSKKLEGLENEIGNHGKVLTFPYSSLASGLSQEEDPDDDD